MGRAKKLLALLLSVGMVATMMPERLYAVDVTAEAQDGETGQSNVGIQSGDQGQQPVSVESMTREAVEQYTVLEMGDTVNITDRNTSVVEFQPETSGFYHVKFHSNNSTSTWIERVDTVYYTTVTDETSPETTHQEEKRKSYGYDEVSGTDIDQVMYLNQEEKYFFYLEDTDGAARDLDVTVGEADITGVELVTDPTEKMYDSMVYIGMQIKLNYADGTSTTTSVESDGRITALRLRQVAYDMPECYDDDLILTAIDGASSWDMETLEDGSHFAEAYITRYDKNGDEQGKQEFTFHFVSSRNAIASIEVVNPTVSEFTQGFGETVNPEEITLKINYTEADGRESETVRANTLNDLKYYLEAGTYQTWGIDDYLNHGGTVGDTTLHVTYRGVSATFPITIKENPYSEIKVTPAITDYYAGLTGSLGGSGDCLSMDGATIEIYYKDTSKGKIVYREEPDNFYYGLSAERVNEDGSTESVSQVRDIDEFIEAGGSVGTNQVECSYYGVTTTFTINIHENPYSKIKVITAPTQNTFIHNQNVGMSMNGLVIRAYEKDNESVYQDFKFDDYDASGYGWSEETGRYYNTNSPLTEIQYRWWNRTFFRTMGGHENVSYLEVGRHDVTISFMGLTDTYQIEVVDKLIKSMELLSAPDRTTFYAGAQTGYSLNGLEFKVTETDGTEKLYRYNYYGDDENIREGYSSWSDMDDSSYYDITSDIDWEEEGEYEVAVNYKGCKVSFPVEFIESPVESIEITKNPSKTVYYAYESVNYKIDGMGYMIHYKDGSSYIGSIREHENTAIDSIEYNGYTYTLSANMNHAYEVGDTVMEITFMGKRVTVPITIKENPVKTLEVVKKPDKVDYVPRDSEIDLYGAQIKITYIDDSTKTVTVEKHTDNVEVENGSEYIITCAYDSSEEAIEIVTLEYMNSRVQMKMNTFDITAYDNLTITEEESKYLKLDSEKRYQVYQFTPETTKEYNFFGVGTGTRTGYAVLYDESGAKIVSDTYSGTSGNFEISQTLEAGKTYYWYVTASNYGDVQTINCILSSQVAHESELENLTVQSFTVNTYPKHVWYDFENQVSEEAISLEDMEYSVTFTSGISYTGELTTTGRTHELFGREIAVKWKNDTADEYGFVDQNQENALVVTYGGEFEQEVAVTFQVPTPVDSITVNQNPWSAGIYQYEAECVTNQIEGLSITIHYNDGRDDQTLKWTQENTPYTVDGYQILLSLRDVDRDEYWCSIPRLGSNAIVLSYMSKRLEIPVTIKENPITKLAFSKNPTRTSYTRYEKRPDLYGATIVITHSDKTTKTVQVTEHTYSVSVDDSYGGVITGSLETDSDSRYITLDYLNLRGQNVLNVSDKSVAEDAVTIAVGESQTVTLDEEKRYQVFAFTPTETKNYSFYSTGDFDTYVTLLNSGENEITYNDDGGANSNFNLTWELTANKTYYYIARMYSEGRSASIQCTLQDAGAVVETPVEAISSVNFNFTTPEAGSDLDTIEYQICAAVDALDANYSVDSVRWTGQDGEGYVDYAVAPQAAITLSPKSNYTFTSSTIATVNGKRITNRTVSSSGKLTLYYNCPYTACKVNVPEVDGYTRDVSGNDSETSVAYDGTYTFRYTKTDLTDTDTLIVKANDKVLTADADDTYTISNVIENVTVVVKRDSLAVDIGQSSLNLYNKTNLYDKIVMELYQCVADNIQENKLPMLESYVNGSDQFFFGWYQSCDTSHNGTGSRFKSTTNVENAKYDLYAKWGTGIFSYVMNNKWVNYKILSFDEDNKMKVQVGDGNSPAVQSGSGEEATGVDATGVAGDDLVIPSTLDLAKVSAMSSLGIDLGDCDVVSIADHAFAGTEDLTNVVLPNTIEKIGSGAFSECTNLAAITLPNSISSIASGTFSGCTSLSAVTIPEGVTDIGSSAFDGCTGLTTVSLPSTVETVDPTAFQNVSTENLTVVCSSEVAQSGVLDELTTAGVTVQTVDVTTDYQYDEKEFSYGDSAQSFTASVAVNGVTDANRTVTWTCSDTENAAYNYEVSENTITVTPIAATDGETYTITATDVTSGQTRTITLSTAAADLAGTDRDGDSIYAITAIANQSYTGKTITPPVEVKNVLKNEVVGAANYRVCYDDNTAIGTASVTVEGTGNYTGTLRTTFKIQAVSVTGVSLSPVSTNVTVGKTLTLKTTVAPSNASNRSVTYQSSNTAVATVTSAGVVKGIKAGSATITATTVDGNKKGTCKVTVVSATVAAASVSLNKTSASIKEKATVKLTATVLPSNTSNKNVTWSSSNTKVATVSAGTVTGVKAGSATITAKTANGKVATCKVIVTAVKIASTKVSLNKKTASLNVKKTVTLKATMAPSNTTDSVSWSSSNKKVATVSTKGVVKGVKVGSVTITAKTSSGKKATCKVTVKSPATKIKLSKKTASVNVKKTVTLKATMTPSNSTDKITWSSSNKKIATVSSKGVVKGVKKGSVTITAKTSSGKKATCKVTVKVPASKVKLNKTSISVKVKKTVTLKATLTPSSSTDKVTWSSSNKKIATVSSKGVVKGVKKGSATITAKTSSGKTAKCKIKVK